MHRALLVLAFFCLTCGDSSSDSGGSLSGGCSPPARSCPGGWCWDYSMPPAMAYKAVGGTDCNNVWIVGGPEHKVILQWNGVAWTVRKHSSPEILYGVWGSDAKNAWAVGGKGTIVQWDGKAWTSLFTGIDLDLYAIWGTSGTNVYIAGQYGIILHKGS